jgi:hypothetical protein
MYMTTEKKTKSLYWTTTAIIVLFDGVVPAFTSNSELAIAGIRHLGYPDYFRTLLTVFKVAGAAALILPFVKSRVKEWAYAGFALSMIAAFVSLWAVDGPHVQTFFPLFILAILITSYVSYHKYRKHQRSQRIRFHRTNVSLSGMPQ